MFRSAQRVSVAMLCLSLGLGAWACAKKQAAESQTSATPSAATPTATPAFSVTGVDLGKSVGGDKRVTEMIEVFSPKDVIYASVLTTGATPTATLKARWTYQDGQVVEESEQTLAPTGDAVTEFHISKPDGWPVGRYKVEILADGVPVQTKEFEVK